MSGILFYDEKCLWNLPNRPLYPIFHHFSDFAHNNWHSKASLALKYLGTEKKVTLQGSGHDDKTFNNMSSGTLIYAEKCIWNLRNWTCVRFIIIFLILLIIIGILKASPALKCGIVKASPALKCGILRRHRLLNMAF